MSRVIVCPVLVVLAACATRSPIEPSSPAATPLAVMSLEAEAGTGEGTLMQRAKASGGQTVHLAPGERRRWTFTAGSAGTLYASYSLLVSYSNDNPGETEVLTAAIDGTVVGSLQARDTGDDGEGWELFATEPIAAFPLAAGPHTLTLESRGGDGCIEIDLVSIY